MKVTAITETTHNPLDESHTGELLAGKPPEQFLWGGAGNGPISYSVPRQSLTRQLAFKRLKQLLQLGHLPHQDGDAARGWIHAKLLVAMLLETLFRNSRNFSPWGYEIPLPAQLKDAA